MVLCYELAQCYDNFAENPKIVSTMMFSEIVSGEIPCLSFLKDTDYAIYIGPELTPEQRDLLKSMPVIYLPEILEQLSEPVVKYNFPGVTLPESLTVESVYAQIRDGFDGRITPESRSIIMSNGDEIEACLIDSFAPRRSKSAIVFQSIKYCKAGSWDLFDALYDNENPSSEEVFNYEMRKAFNEAENVIKNLLLKGCPPELLLNLINQSVKLSHLRITKQFKIFLTDYDNEEIKMGPLPKTVFLFFLRHPEGVMFSHLQNYREELLRIYGQVCTNDDPRKMEDSIDRLINPFDNSICEKCANVKKAFILKIADNSASNYYISGAQGEKKLIPIDRSLVEWECEL